MHRIPLSLMALLASVSCVQAAKPPNIVLIMADDLGWSDLHCQGNQLLDTPTLPRQISWPTKRRSWLKNCGKN